MKRTTFLALLAGMILAGCSSKNMEEPQNNEVEVSLHFTRFQIEQQSMTRATDVSEYVTHLDIWIYEGGSEIGAYHQATGSEGFGSLSLTLNSTKTYTIYAVAHKGSAAASMADGVVTFPDDKVTHTFFYTDTFTPTKGMEKVCSMNRIVAQFMVSTTDAVPSEVKKVRITLGNVFTRWNVAGYGVNAIDKVSTISITSTKADGTVDLITYGITTNENTNHNVLVEALDASDAVVQTQTFENVPLRNGYRTVATGNVFTDAPSSFSFTAEDWETNTNYNF